MSFQVPLTEEKLWIYVKFSYTVCYKNVSMALVLNQSDTYFNHFIYQKLPFNNISLKGERNVSLHFQSFSNTFMNTSAIQSAFIVWSLKQQRATYPT